jgi:Carboxypeptidase regulatory-like domain/TonB-dependent Receptor Plug Domain
MNTGRRERRQGGLWLLCFLLSLGALLGTANILQAQERTGIISGQLKDASGGVLPGASVVITNKATGRATTLTTDGSGMYRADLDPGAYSVRFEMSGFARQEQPDVTLLLGKTVTLNVEMKVGNMSEAVQVTAETAPLVDTKTATVSHNVTAEEFDRMPKARSFQSVALSSPGVNQGDIEGGIQIHGASGAENSYTVDGVTTNSVIYGSSREDTVFEYLQEVEVKTGGIDAQYGGALGGVISAVTKSGGNVYHGEGHYYFSGNAISAGPVQRLVLSPVDNNTVTNQQDSKFPLKRNEFGGSIGGPIAKNRLFFFGSVSPRLIRRSNDYSFDNGADPKATFNQKQTLMQAFGKVSYASPGQLQANFSVLTTPTKSTGTLPAYGGNGPNFALSSPAANSIQQTRGYQTNQTSTSGDVNWLFSRNSSITFKGGYFHDNYKDTGVPNTTSYTYQVTSVGLANIPASLQAPKGTFNTPRIEISQHDTTTRGYAQGDFTSSFTAGGIHFLKAGAGYQRTSNDVNNAYPGGYVFVYWNSSVANYNGSSRGTGTYGYYRVVDLCSGCVDAYRPPDAQSRREDGTRNRSIVQPGRQEKRF